MDHISLLIQKLRIELLLLSNKPILAHNAKFDIKFTFEKYGILFKNIHCTMIAEYLITEAREKYPSYQELGYKYLGEMVEKDTVMKFVEIKETGAELTQDMLIYGAVDVLWLDEIRKQQLELIASKKMQKVLSLEMQLIPVVTIMECNGVMIDRDKWMGLYEIALEKSDTLREEIIDAVWRFCFADIIPNEPFVDIRDFLLYMHIPFKKTKKEGKRLEVITFDNPEDMITIEQEFKERLNLASPKQVKKFLQLMGSGVDSTAEKVLVSLAKRLPIAKLLLDFRKNYKRVTTYGLEFLANVKEDGRIYARFNQIGTTTGRFSSRKPNLQNIIKGSEYRSCFIAPEGKKIITADYSQQEFRLAGELSGETAIIEAYQKGEDMHTATASMLFGIPLEEVTEEALELYPNQPLVYFFNGMAKNQLKDYNGAIEILTIGEQLVVDNPLMKAQMNATLGDAYNNLKEYALSDSSFEKSLRFDPENSYVLNNYSYYLSVRDENLEKAKDMSAKSIELEPTNSAFLDTYAWILYRLKDYKEAKVWIEKSIENGGNESSVILEHYGDILFKLGEVDKAVIFWGKAEALGSDSELIGKKIADRKIYE